MKKFTLILLLLLVPVLSHAAEDKFFRLNAASGQTASRLAYLNALREINSVADLTAWIAGTANQITSTDDADGSLTLSLPQDIHTGASPEFVGLLLSGLTASRLVATDGSKNLISSDVVNWLAGSANEIEIIDDADGTATIGIVTSPTLDGTNFTGIPDGALDEDYLLVSEIDDTPVDGELTAPISSNWAYDHADVALDPHTQYPLVDGTRGIDQSNAAAAIPAFSVEQADVDEPAFKIIGTGSLGSVINTIVDSGDVGTATIAGYVLIEIQDDGNQVADGDYYLAVYTLDALASTTDQGLYRSYIQTDGLGGIIY